MLIFVLSSKKIEGYKTHSLYYCYKEASYSVSMSVAEKECSKLITAEVYLYVLFII